MLPTTSSLVFTFLHSLIGMNDPVTLFDSEKRDYEKYPRSCCVLLLCTANSSSSSIRTRRINEFKSFKNYYLGSFRLSTTVSLINRRSPKQQLQSFRNSSNATSLTFVSFFNEEKNGDFSNVERVNRKQTVE